MINSKLVSQHLPGGERFDDAFQSTDWNSESYDTSLSNPNQYVQKRVDKTDTDNEDEFQDRITEDDILHEQILEDFGGNLCKKKQKRYTHI